MSVSVLPSSHATEQTTTVATGLYITLLSEHVTLKRDGLDTGDTGDTRYFAKNYRAPPAVMRHSQVGQGRHTIAGLADLGDC